MPSRRTVLFPDWGVLLSGADPKVSDRMFTIGEAFGMAFQIEDDILDYTCAKEKMGEAAGKHLREGIPALLLILAL